jgi:hypothetical protein
MTLRLALCFLFHQPLGEPAARACRICYRGVIDVLRNHPRLHVNLLLSGTLLDAMGWFDPSFLAEIRRGVDDGRFHLLGSTYAQNLIPACDDWDNRHQIAQHRRTLEGCFGVKPDAFWCPHRAWAGRAAPMIAEAGYRVLPLEERTLRAAGAADPVVHRHPFGGGSLRILWDDAPARMRLDCAAWFRHRRGFADTLSTWRVRPDADTLFPVISENAAAFGLWGYDAGLDPRADLAGLDALLDVFSREDGILLSSLADAPEAGAVLESIPDGWGEELDRVLAEPDSVRHEEGYADWGDFVRRAPRLDHFQKIHGGVRMRLTAVEKLSNRPETCESGRRLFALAGRTYCAHQTEFGAVGIGGRGYPAWEGIGAAIAVAKTAELAFISPEAEGGMIDDITGDGEDEVILSGGGYAAVLTAYGGRLLFWADIRNGKLHVGNPLAAATGTLFIEARSPEPAPVPDDWLPGPDDPESPEAYEPAPGRRGNRMGGECLLEESALPYRLRPQSAKLRPSLPVRRRALNDFFSLDDGPEESPEPRLDFRLAKGAVTFLRFFGYRLQMTKRVRLAGDGLRVVYHLRNVDHRPIRVRLRTVSEVSPDYQDVLDHPGPSLAPVRFGPRGQPGIQNLHTGCTWMCQASRIPSEPAKFRSGVLAWEAEQAFSFVIPAGRTETLILRWQLLPADSAGQCSPVVS